MLPRTGQDKNEYERKGEVGISDTPPGSTVISCHQYVPNLLSHIYAICYTLQSVSTKDKVMVPDT